nr:hypothetical protein [uncultured Campylobacter sp.]
MFRFILPAVRAVCFVLLAVRRLSYGVYCAIRLAPSIYATRRAVSVFAMGLPAILPRRICELLRHVEFYLKFYRYEILKLSSKFRACRISTLKFYGRRCEQDKFRF